MKLEEIYQPIADDLEAMESILESSVKESKNPSIHSFKTFYISKEKSNCPLVADILRVDKNFKKSNLFDDVSDIIISLKYGRRVLINSENSKLGEIEHEDLIEIVEYDPLKKVLLVMGAKEPKINSSVHWLIHYAKKEINAAIQIDSQNLKNSLKDKIPETEKELPKGSVDLAKEILMGLRNSKALNLKNNGVLFVGNSITETEDCIMSIIGSKK